MHVFSPGASGRLLLLLGLLGLVACDPNDNPPTPCVEGSDRPECVPDSGTPGPRQDDHGNTPAEATPITSAAEPLTGAFDASGDLDVFSAVLQARHLYRSTCEGVTARDCAVEVLDAAGERQAQRAAGSSSVFKAPADGTYFLQLRSPLGDTGTYRYRFEDLGLDDHGDGRESATSVPTSNEVHGTLTTSADTDAFIFFATEVGYVYRFGCDAVEGVGLGLTLEDGATGAQVDTTVGLPNTSTTVSVEVTAAGTYYALVTAGSSSGPSVPFTCRVEKQRLDDHGDSRAQATPLSPSSPVEVHARFETVGDLDVFSFTATEGHIYVARCEAGTVSECIVRLRNADGQLVGGDSSYGWTRELTVGGTYYLEVVPRLFEVGTYTLRLTDGGLDDHGDGAGIATPVTMGSSVTGWNHSPDDVDAFSFPATAETVYRVTCTAQPGDYCSLEPHSPSETVRRVRYTDHIDIDVSVTETLTVFVTGGFAGYTVKFEEVGRDDHGDSAANATPLVLGASTAGNIETPFDRDFFSIALTAGIQYQLVPFSGDSFELTLRAADGTPISRGSLGEFTPTADGTFFVVVGSNVTPGRFPTGGYSVLLKLYDGTLPPPPPK